MADERPSEDRQIEEILTDLDTILSDLTEADEGVARSVEMPAPTEPPAVIPPPATQAPAPVVPAKPTPAPVAQPPKPAAAPVTPPVAAPTPAPAAKNDDSKIELAPREGTLTPQKKPATPAPEKKTSGLPAHPPLEIPSEPLSVPPAPQPAPVVPPAAPAPKPAAAPVVQSAAPTPEPAIAPAVADDIPEGTPHEFVRRVAALYLPAHAGLIPQFFAFIAQSAQTVSKKPLMLRRVLVSTVEPSSDVAALAARAQAVNAVAAIVVIEGLPDAKSRELAAAFKQANIDFREVAPGDLLKRSVAVDILVEIMLLPSEL